jgi:uncharacterized protein (TIGR03118 family)
LVHVLSRRRALFASIAAAIGIASNSSVMANDADGDRDDAVAFVKTNLDSNLSGIGALDSNLTNAWGLAFAPGGAFWVSGNHSGTSNLINGDGSVAALAITIPAPKSSSSGTISAPTGIISNSTGSFHVPGTALPALFIFDTEDGTIAAWNSGVDLMHAVIVVDNSSSGANYKGLTFGSNASGNFIFATNFRSGNVDVFDTNFAPVTTDGRFIDRHIPRGFAPFGIQNIDGDLWVTYAKQDAQKDDDVAGPGNGFVDVFDTDGHLLRRFAERGSLNSPWGMARAPYGFGQFSGDILIGNQQDGHINAFDSHGNFVGSLRRPNGESIKIDKLWALQFGGGAKSSPESLFFTAGPNDENNGLFGVINAVSATKDAAADKASITGMRELRMPAAPLANHY